MQPPALGFGALPRSPLPRHFVPSDNARLKLSRDSPSACHRSNSAGLRLSHRCVSVSPAPSNRISGAMIRSAAYQTALADFTLQPDVATSEVADGRTRSPVSGRVAESPGNRRAQSFSAAIHECRLIEIGSEILKPTRSGDTSAYTRRHVRLASMNNTQREYHARTAK